MASPSDGSEVGELDANGNRTGLWRSFRPDGSLRWEQEMRHGLKHGRVQWFHPDGTLGIDTTVEDGIQQTTVHTFDGARCLNRLCVDLAIETPDPDWSNRSRIDKPPWGPSRVLRVDAGRVRKGAGPALDEGILPRNEVRADPGELEISASRRLDPLETTLFRRGYALISIAL